MLQGEAMAGTGAVPWDENGELEVLTFDVGDERLAIEAVSIREILDLLPETRVPGAPELVASVVNFRGKIIPIADLRLAFGLPRQMPDEAGTDNRIVVIEAEIGGEALQIGLRSDKVHEVTILDRASSSEPPVLGMRWKREYVRELVRQQGSVIVLPDLSAIFTALVEVHR